MKTLADGPLQQMRSYSFSVGHWLAAAAALAETDSVGDESFGTQTSLPSGTDDSLEREIFDVCVPLEAGKEGEAVKHGLALQPITPTQRTRSTSVSGGKRSSNGFKSAGSMDENWERGDCNGSSATSTSDTNSWSSSSRIGIELWRRQCPVLKMSTMAGGVYSEASEQSTRWESASGPGRCAMGGKSLGYLAGARADSEAAESSVSVEAEELSSVGDAGLAEAEDEEQAADVEGLVTEEESISLFAESSPRRIDQRGVYLGEILHKRRRRSNATSEYHFLQTL